jgi:hypothetical protein
MKLLRFLLSATFGLCGTVAAVDLVKDGKPVAEIVLSDTAAPSVKTAALELQRHLESMSGAKLPIVHQVSSGVKNQVYVGDSEAVSKFAVSLDDIKYDGFKIIAEKNHVILAGREFDHFEKSFSRFRNLARNQFQPAWEEYTGHKWRFPPIIDFPDFNKECGFHLWDGTGTLYAAYELLGQLGMRWYMPIADLGLVIPKLKNISIKDQNLMRQPQFPIRILTDGGNGRFKEEFLWYKSMGVGTAINMPIYHSLSGPLEISPREQPQEYYGMVNSVVNYMVPKLSNERLRKDMVEYLEWVDKAFPEIPYVCIGQPDGWSVMDSADAAAGWDKFAERGEAGRFSEYMWDFIMDIRKRYMEKHPDKKFTVFAYSSTKRPPANLEKVPDNVSVVFCQTSNLWMNSRADLESRKEWLAKISNKDQLLIWEYYVIHAPNYHFPPIPVIFTKLMKENFDGLYNRCAGFLGEAGWSSGEDKERNKLVLPRPALSHLMLYLHSRLCWDANLDLQTVLDEYYNLFYGPAHAEMKEFFEFSESVWMRPESRQVTANGGFLKPEDVRRYFDILDRAKARAGNTIYGKRIDLIAGEMQPLKLLFESLKRTGPKVEGHGADGPVVIDGDIDKPFWRAMKNSSYSFLPLRDMMTGEYPAHVNTTVSFRWLHDNSALIVGIECKEPKMNKLREGSKDRDSSSIYSDDNVEIQLETAQGLLPKIVVNPAGVVLDECVTGNVADLASFYTVKEVAVKKYPDRWTVEVKIDAKPISGERPTPAFPWGVNVCRQRMAGNTPEYYMLSPSGTDFRDKKCMGNLTIRN